MNQTGSTALIQALLKEGVDLIFGYQGGAIMPSYDALYDVQEEIKHVMVRHEQGAVHAAEGYARATGKTGVCFATSGPGATNLVTGIADAMLDSVPIVCITGQVNSAFLGTDAFQEVDIMSITAPITKWSYQVSDAEDIPDCIAKAFHLARSGRPGPVVVDITKDAQMGEFKKGREIYKGNTSKAFKEEPTQHQVIRAANLINGAKKPLMFVGQGVLLSGAEKAARELAEKADIPVASTLLGLSSFPGDHRLHMGMLGMHGNYAPNLLTNEADVIIAVGMRFDDRVTGALSRYAKQAEIIHIDIDASELNKNVPVSVAIHADARKTLESLFSHVHENKHSEWVEKFYSCRGLEKETVFKKDFKGLGEDIKMAEAVDLLSRMAPKKTVVVTDVGQHQMVTARYFDFQQTNAHITSGGLGTMGFALPAAIGAKMGRRDNEVLAVIGDGGFQMCIQELGVIMQEKLPVKIVILNNSFLGMVRQWQELFHGGRYSCVEMVNPEFTKIAEGYGIKSRKVQKREDLAEAIKEMFSSDEAYLLEIAVEKEQKVYPMVPPGSTAAEVVLA
ncbi:MAG: acetolactate synthase-1/2/3 large subunit [Chlamydiales bacterium]|jgi:acetolactate synthase-1/2/3 large subunit